MLVNSAVTADNMSTSALAGLQDANPTIWPYMATGAPQMRLPTELRCPILTAPLQFVYSSSRT